MGKGKRARQARRTGEGIPRDDNPWRDEMVPAYAEVFKWAADNPEMAAEVTAMSEADAGVWVELIAAKQEPDFPAVGTARVLRRWAILNGVVWLYDWPKPVSVMTDEEIVAAVRAGGA